MLPLILVCLSQVSASSWPHAESYLKRTFSRDQCGSYYSITCPEQLDFVTHLSDPGRYLDVKVKRRGNKLELHNATNVDFQFEIYVHNSGSGALEDRWPQYLGAPELPRHGSISISLTPINHPIWSITISLWKKLADESELDLVYGRLVYIKVTSNDQ